MMETMQPSPLSSSLSQQYYEEEQCQSPSSSSSSSMKQPTSYTNEATSDKEDIIKNFLSFKKECAKLGISLEEVKNAAKESVSFYKKWWWTDNSTRNHDDDRNQENNHDTNLNTDNKNKDSMAMHPAAPTSDMIIQAKTEALIALRRSNGDTTCPHFQCAVRALSSTFRSNTTNSVDIQNFDGEWLTLSRPNYPNCLGHNEHGDCLYTLGRMSFDMFRPTNLRCSIKKTIVKSSEVPLSLSNYDITKQSEDGNDCHRINLDHLTIPRNLRKEIIKIIEQQKQQKKTNTNDNNDRKEKGGKVYSPLWTFNITTYFIVEPLDSQAYKSTKVEETKYDVKEECIAPSKPLKAKMTNYGYIVTNPKIKHQFSIWFTRGVVAPSSTKVNKNTKKKPIKEKKQKKQENNSSGQNVTSSSSCHTTSKTTNNSNPQEHCIPVDDGNSSVSSIKSTEGIMTTITCPLPLQECRMRNKHCELHGVQKMSRKNRDAVNEKLASRYNKRPSHIIRNYNFLLAQQQQLQPPPHSNLEWEDIFAPEDNWKRTMGEYAKALAAKAFLGAEVPDHMEDDGSMEFRLNRPISAYIDVLYMDDDIRITKGNYGTTFVHVRNSIYKKLSSNSK